jgi:type IV fimbrial biogenesis protein FimT
VEKWKFQGYTIFELLIVLAIVLILSVVSFPLLNRTIQKYRLTTATEQLYNVFQYARNEAVKQNANIYVSFNTGDSWCYGVNLNSACNCTVAGNCSLGVYSAPKGGSIYFEGTHGAANASGSVTYTLYGGSTLMTISIGRLGNLRICSTGLSGYTAC